MPPIEILQLLPELDPGGAERVVLSLARHLPPERFRVTVAALDGRGALGDAFRELGCPVIDLGVRRRWPGAGAQPLADLIVDTHAAIVHSHLFRAHLTAAQAMGHLHLPAGGHPPVFIATEHQADPRRWALALLRLATRRATLVTAVSLGVRDHLQRHGFPAEKLRTIPNGIELDAIDGQGQEARATHGPDARATLQIPADAQVALFVGRLARQKGLDVLLRAMAQIAADVPALHLLVVGDGPERPALEKLARRLNLAARVHFLGRRDDVPQLLKSADLAVLPSRWEGLSLVLLEAMATGRPIVATAVEGTAEVLRHEATGLLVPPEDPGALAAALRRLAADPALARRLGAAARAVALRDHGAATMASRYAALYEEALPL